MGPIRRGALLVRGALETCLLGLTVRSPSLTSASDCSTPTRRRTPSRHVALLVAASRTRSSGKPRGQACTCVLTICAYKLYTGCALSTCQSYIGWMLSVRPYQVESHRAVHSRPIRVGSGGGAVTSVGCHVWGPVRSLRSLS